MPSMSRRAYRDRIVTARQHPLEPTIDPAGWQDLTG
jgi:hypothetical protein